MAQAKRDQNYVPTLIGTSSTDNTTPINVLIDPVTGRLLVDVSGSGSGGTAMTDDAAFTPGTTQGTPIFAMLDDSAPDSVDEGDAGIVRMSANRVLYVQIRDAQGNERGLRVTAGGAILVDGSATTQPVSGTVEITNDVGNAIPVSGTVTETNSAAIAASLNTMDDWDNAASDGASVSGDTAHDAADSGEPLKIGGKAVTAPPAAVAGNDRVNGMFDIYGRLIVMNALREMKGSQITTITASTSETTVITADATYKLDVYGVIIVNTSATATEVSFKDSTAGTTRFWVSVPANDMRGFMLPMDAGHLQASANNNWTATCADSVSSIIITMFFTKNL